MTPSNHHPPPQLVLASRSPRRQELLREAGYDFVIDPADVDEDDYPPEVMPADLALRLARMKSHAVAPRRPEDLILGADTVVAFGDKILGKPEDAAHAREMLRLLSGTTHIVITGVSVVRVETNFSQEKRVMSAVQMRPLTMREIDDYVASGLWQGKAGGYGIQDKDPFVKRLSGCYTNIVGLPMTTTKALLASAGVTPSRPPEPPPPGGQR
ncbi:MAG TPA: Maf family protein [Tepidisphaeraceae bacterium]|jgi:septum formation protein